MLPSICQSTQNLNKIKNCQIYQSHNYNIYSFQHIQRRYKTRFSLFCHLNMSHQRLQTNIYTIQQASKKINRLQMENHCNCVILNHLYNKNTQVINSTFTKYLVPITSPNSIIYNFSTSITNFLNKMTMLAQNSDKFILKIQKIKQRSPQIKQKINSFKNKVIYQKQNQKFIEFNFQVGMLRNYKLNAKQSNKIKRNSIELMKISINQSYQDRKRRLILTYQIYLVNVKKILQYHLIGLNFPNSYPKIFYLCCAKLSKLSAYSGKLLRLSANKGTSRQESLSFNYFVKFTVD